MTSTDSQPSNRPQITTGFQDLLAEANSAISTLSVEEAMDRLADDEVVFVDVRDAPELEREGKIPGAVHASRGMLEFLVDPDSPFHEEALAHSGEFVLYCSIGGRSALSAQRLQEMGIESVGHIEGGFSAWKEAGGPITAV